MERVSALERLIIGSQDLVREAARVTRNEAPAAQWRALRSLRDDGPQRIGSLASTCRTTQPGMTRLVGQMADAGLVTRSSDAADSRVTRVSVTDAGIRALAAWRAQLHDSLMPMFTDLPDEDWQAIRRVAELLGDRAHAGSAVAR